jgi:hypothetical protein
MPSNEPVDQQAQEQTKAAAAAAVAGENLTQESEQVIRDSVSKGGAKDIALYLRNVRGLTNLDLSETKLSDQGAIELAGAFALTEDEKNAQAAYQEKLALHKQDTQYSEVEEELYTKTTEAYKKVKASHDKVTSLRDVGGSNYYKAVDLYNKDVVAYNEVAKSYKALKSALPYESEEMHLKLKASCEKAINIFDQKHAENLADDTQVKTPQITKPMPEQPSAPRTRVEPIEPPKPDKFNNTLTSLNLSNNQISDKGVTALCASLKENEKLEFIDLSNNNISDASVEKLRTLMTDNKSIRIKLDGNKFTESSLKTLEEGFPNNVLTAKTISASRTKMILDLLLFSDLGKAGGSLHQGDVRDNFFKALQEADRANVLLADDKNSIINKAIDQFRLFSVGGVKPQVNMLVDKRFLSVISTEQFKSVLQGTTDEIDRKDPKTASRNENILFGPVIPYNPNTNVMNPAPPTLLDKASIQNMTNEQIYVLFNHIDNNPKIKNRLQSEGRIEKLNDNENPKSRGDTRWSEVIETMKDCVFKNTLEKNVNITDNSAQKKQQAKTNLLELANNPEAKKLMGAHASTSLFSFGNTKSLSKLNKADEVVDYATTRAKRVTPRNP